MEAFHMESLVTNIIKPIFCLDRAHPMLCYLPRLFSDQGNRQVKFIIDGRIAKTFEEAS